MNKKEYPLKIHKDLNTLKEKFSEYHKFSSASNPMLKFEDTDESSGFYFQINNFQVHNSEFYYEIISKPISENDLGTINKLSKFTELDKEIQAWIEIIEKFDNTPHYNNDPIIESYIEEYYAEYKLLDEDAEIAPFDLKRQLLIDKYLEDAIIFIEAYEEKNSENLAEPKEIAINLKKDLTNLTKNQVIKGLSKLWAVSRKKGLPVLKEIFFELAKELIIGFGKKLLGLE